MNRHRNNWSAMGINERNEQSQISKDYDKLREDLVLMVGKFGVDEITKELRKLVVDNNKKCKNCKDGEMKFSTISIENDLENMSKITRETYRCNCCGFNVLTKSNIGLNGEIYQYDKFEKYD